MDRAELRGIVAEQNCFESVSVAVSEDTLTARFDIVPRGPSLSCRDYKSSVSVRANDGKAYNATLRFPSVPTTASSAHLHHAATTAAAKGGFASSSIKRHRSSDGAKYVHLDVDVAPERSPTAIHSEQCHNTEQLVERLAVVARAYLEAF